MTRRTKKSKKPCTKHIDPALLPFLDALAEMVARKLLDEHVAQHAKKRRKRSK